MLNNGFKKEIGFEKKQIESLIVHYLYIQSFTDLPIRRIRYKKL